MKHIVLYVALAVATVGCGGAGGDLGAVVSGASTCGGDGSVGVGGDGGDSGGSGGTSPGLTPLTQPTILSAFSTAKAGSVYATNLDGSGRQVWFVDNHLADQQNAFTRNARDRFVISTGKKGSSLEHRGSDGSLISRSALTGYTSYSGLATNSQASLVVTAGLNTATSHWQVISMTAKGTSAKTVVDLGSSPQLVTVSDLSPDGSTVLFSVKSGSSSQEFSCGTIGSSATPLTPAGQYFDSGSFSFDGSMVTLTGRSNGGDPTSSQVYEMGSGGTGLHAVSPASTWAFTPRFSPDGQSIFFGEEVSNGSLASNGIYRAGIDGSGLALVYSTNPGEAILTLVSP